MKRRFSPARLARCRRAFALVLVLIIISVLALVCVSFLASMGQERATASAFANKARAEQSAQAGVDTAMGILKDYFRAFPDSVTVWDTAQSKNDDGTSNEGTSLYLRAVSADATHITTDSPNPKPGNSTDAGYNDANYVHGNNPNNADGTSGADGRHVFVLPLVSGASVERFENKANSVRGAGDTVAAGGTVAALKVKASEITNAVNLNARRNTVDTTGWIGTPPGYVNPQNTAGNILPKPFFAPWVEIKQQDGSASPPVIGRYAFWVEDESFRANIAYADGRTDLNGNFTPNDTRRDNDPTLPSARMPLNATDVSLLGFFTYLSNVDSAILGSMSPLSARTNLLAARSVYPGKVFPDGDAYMHIADINKATGNSLRYLTTTQSAGLNLSRHGTQRMSLNAVVDQSVTPTNTAAIQKQFDKIVDAIQFHAPNFGQRFYRRSADVTPTELNGTYVPSTTAKPYTKMYVAKVAANIRDYIDSDAFPTCVMAADNTNPNGKVAAATPPTQTIGDPPGPAWALGKDSAPFMQECGVRYRGTVSGSDATATYQLKIDYYIEVWNMSNRNVNPGDLGPNAFIRIGNPVRWYGCRNDNGDDKAAGLALRIPLSTSDGSVSPSNGRSLIAVRPPPQMPRDFDIDISGCTFPAGMCTVITTDSDYTDIITDLEARTHVLRCQFKSPGTNVYNGSMPASPAFGKKGPAGFCNAIIAELTDNPKNLAPPPNTSDYATYVIIGSDWGHIDSLVGALPITYLGQIYFPYNSVASPASEPAPVAPPIYGGYLRGNWTNDNTANNGKEASTLGDPRTNNEQIEYQPTNTDAADKTRFTAFDTSAPGVFPTFGQLNYQSCRPNRPDNPWPDFPPYYGNATGNSSISGVTATELDMSTPAKALAKAPATVANGPLTSIGQLGDVFDPARLRYTSVTGNSTGTFIASRGGGRTFKIGQHDDRWDGDETSFSRGWTSWRLADFFCVADPVSQPGTIDFNGINQLGLFNINGITRDNGAALRAALYGFRFQAATNGGDPTLADPTDAPSRLQVDALVKQIAARLTSSPLNTDGTGNTGPLQTGAGPFWERGEVSELPLFGRTVDTAVANSVMTYATTDLTGVDMSSRVFDRGREELGRRLIEMVTTRGSIFTVYAMGQALHPDPNNASTRHVVSTCQLRVTFRLVPKGPVNTSTGISPDFHPGVDSMGVFTDSGKSTDPAMNYNPNNSAQLSARFAKPDHYDVQIISVSSGSN